MNIVTLVINHLTGRTSIADAPTGFFSNFTLAGARRMLMICAGIGAGLALFFGGALAVLLDLILTSRDHQQLLLSPASIVGFALIGISFLFMAGLFSRKMWRMAPQLRHQVAAAPSPVQEAMAELIRDFVEERRMGREFAAEQLTAQAAAAAAMEPTSASRAETASQTTNSIPPYPVHSAYN